MPIEVLVLSARPEPMEFCPRCGSRFHSFLRGEVQTGWRKWLGLAYCAVICRACREIVGREKP
jgi:hypothetical protein